VKQLVWFAAAAALVVVALVFTRSRENSPDELPPVGTNSTKPPVRSLPENTAPPTVHPISETAASLGSAETSPSDDISTLSLMISQYGKIHGGNPVGENDEITSALMGKNPKRLAFLPQEGSFLDGSGHLIDRWGTPYFFHALSGSKMEIISPGPDRILHTADDITSD
jgi:hypothetical protein